MKIYLVITTFIEGESSVGESSVEVCYSAAAASDFIKTHIGEIMIGYVTDKDYEGAKEELETLIIERDLNNHIVYASMGVDDHIVYYEVFEKEVKIND